MLVVRQAEENQRNKMNLEEMFEAAKAKHPSQRLDVSRHLSTVEGSEEWYWIMVCESDKYNGPTAIGSTAEEALDKLIVPDRIAQARKMIEDGNKILAEESFSTHTANSGGE
jgi:hypothetical protein